MKLINRTYETYKKEPKEIQEKYYIDNGKRLSMYALACGYIQKMESIETVPYEVTITDSPFMSTMPKYMIKLVYQGTYTVSFWREGKCESICYFGSRKEAEQKFRGLCKYVETLKE